ncbi:MAG: hypothetical protein H7323_16170, partial [Frankiales bacterium]|nr:hypothetical protein [Frankiales bacterium]
MLTSRDRLLAALFALQLVAAAIFGLVLVNGLGQTTVQQVSTAGPGQDAAVVTTVSAAPSAVASGSAAGAGTAGTAGTAESAATTGPGGTTRTAPGSAPGPVAVGPAKVAQGAPIKIGSIVTQTGAINFAASAQGTKAFLDRV